MTLKNFKYLYLLSLLPSALLPILPALVFTQKSFADFENTLPKNFPSADSDSSDTTGSKKSLDKKKNNNQNPTSKETKSSTEAEDKESPESDVVSEDMPSSDPTDASASGNKKDSKKSKKHAKKQEKDDDLFGSDLTAHDTNAPVYFQSKTGNGSKKLGTMNLIGDVVIIQDMTTLKSDKAQLFAKSGTIPGSGTNKIEKAIATGHVNILKKAKSKGLNDLRASGNKAEFYVDKKLMILEGNAKVWRGIEYVNADVIKINLETSDVTLITPKGTLDPRSANNGMEARKSSSSKKVSKK